MPGQDALRFEDLPLELQEQITRNQEQARERAAQRLEELMIVAHDEGERKRLGGFVPYCEDCARSGPTLAPCDKPTCPHRLLGSW